MHNAPKNRILVEGHERDDAPGDVYLIKSSTYTESMSDAFLFVSCIPGETSMTLCVAVDDDESRMEIDQIKIPQIIMKSDLAWNLPNIVFLRLE